MSTRSYVAFRDENDTTGIYVHCDGYPAERLKVLRQIFHGTFCRDLAQMRTVLLKHDGGWSSLTTDTAFTAQVGASPGRLDVPGVGVAYDDDGGTMTATGEAVFDEAYAYVLDIADRSLTVYEGGEVTMRMPEELWAPIGPKPFVRRELPIVAADPPGQVCLSGLLAPYTEGDISRLMRALDLEPGDALGIRDGGDLHDFVKAATDTGLLPGEVWFCTDGNGEGGWIRLPYDLPGAMVTTRFFAARDYADTGHGDTERPETRRVVRELLESIQAAIALAVRSLEGWRDSTPGFVLNIRHPDFPTETHVHGISPETHTIDLGSSFHGHARTPKVALEWAARQVLDLHHWPRALRLVAAAEIKQAVAVSEKAVKLGQALAEDTVDLVAVALAASVLGIPTPGPARDHAHPETWNRLRTPLRPRPVVGYNDACRSVATAQD